MTSAQSALLEDRGVVSVTGEDAEKLLQGIVTNDLDVLANEPAIHAALLTPQGKILFEFLIAKVPGGFLLDTAKDKAADLTKRLTMYKLRAKAAIDNVSDRYGVVALWGTPPSAPAATTSAVTFPDPRLEALGQRRLAPLPLDDSPTASASGYHAHRIALGVPEGGKDYALGDAFPHEALLDQLHGVSFEKGCYVGQEVVSRMEHRATVRKRVVPMVANTGLPASNPEIKAGDVAIGTLGSVSGNRGLALIRLDRAAEFEAKGVPLTAGDIPVRIELPAFAGFALQPTEPAAP